MTFPENATVVLVHGAWADGSSWSKVILPLEQQGLRVSRSADSSDLIERRRHRSEACDRADKRDR